MHLSVASVLFLGGFATSLASAGSTGASNSTAQLQESYIKALRHEVQGRNATQCQWNTMKVRKSWSNLTADERQSYLAAVHCLYTTPNKISASTVPGARNRFDDFTYSHINQTNFVHNSGLLLPWHRQYVWSYEQALRTECAYNGSLPYWDWAEHSSDQRLSPVFDGSSTSFGGNGKAVPHGTQTAPLPGLPTPITLTRAPGTGGGCVEKLGGLPANFTINIGPVSPSNNSADNVYGYDYNPRCLKRDFLPSLSASALTSTNVSTLLNSRTIADFRGMLEASMHPAAHSSTGGDAFDLYSSPTDPIFYLLHSQVDRLWSIWQGQDYSSRTNALDGTVTFMNDPPSQNATLKTVMIMHLAGGNVLIEKAMSTFDQDYCYRYE